MRFQLLLQKFFRGYLVLEKTNSKINDQIEIREDIFGRRSLLVGGISQSGHSVEKLWQKPLKLITGHQSPVTKILILGLGAGSVAKIIHNFFPKAKMTGVEIDPMMIEIGKKYFDLSTVKNLKVEIKDVLNWFCDLNHEIKKFDLILIDLYIGDRVPKEVISENFLKNVRGVLSPLGVAIFNRLYYGQKKKEANQFEARLKKIFSQVEPLHVASNLFFLCR